MVATRALERPVVCFGDPESSFPCHREAVVAIAAVGVTPSGGPLPMFAASCKEHRAALRRFIAGQSVDPSDPEYGVQFYPLEPFLQAVEARLDPEHPEWMDWHALTRDRLAG